MFQLGTSIFFVLTVPQVVAIVERCNEHGRHSWRIFPAYGQFLGGSISYTGGDVGGKMMMNLDVLTGWRLGMGPCGKTCNRTSIGSLTKQTRFHMENEMNDATYFGIWNSEIQRPYQTIISSSLTDMVRTRLSGTVLSVSETDQWEQELMEISIPVEANISHKDVNFEGCSWINLTRQSFNLPWHVQAKMDPVTARNDTKKPNGSPQVLYKPLYRIKLNEESTLNIAAIDPDDDYVKCGQALYMEAGIFSLSSLALSGVTITEDCSVKINASVSLGYRDMDSAAVILSVNDFNKHTIYVGNNVENVIVPGMFSLSSTVVQFVIEVHSNLKGPEFVSPTKEDNHLFYLYADTMWTTDVYAKLNDNGSMNFTVIARVGERIIQSSVKSDIHRPGVKYMTLSWEPNTSDIGFHIICVRAVDKNGVDSAKDKCFIIRATDKKFKGINHASNRIPFFYNVPKRQDVLCYINATCVIPLNVMTQGNANITSVRIIQKSVTTAHLGVITKKGTNDFKSDLYFSDSKSGVGKICMVAEDSEGKQSNETCVDVYTQPPDPCAAFPCQNSGLCKTNPDDELDYLCVCSTDSKNRFFGKNCDQLNHTSCKENPCIRGVCHDLQYNYRCRCPVGYGGRDCGTESLLNCTTQPCQGHGVCRNGPGSYTCDCFQRFEGINCSTDLCSDQDAESFSCPPASGCSSTICSGHGVCREGGICVCSYGFEGPRCQTAKGNLKPSKILFVPPTPNESSSLICYSFTRDACVISVFVTTPQSSTSVVTVSKQSNDLVNTTSVSSLREAQTTGFQHVYSANVTITKGQNFKVFASGRRIMCLTALESSTNTTAHRCLELKFLYNSQYVANSLELHGYRAHVKFVAPTLLGESRLICQQDARCHMIFYTTLKLPCKEIYTTSSEVTVFPPMAAQGSCITEASFLSNKTGDHRICFVSASQDGQTRCYIMSVYIKTKGSKTTTSKTAKSTTSTSAKFTTSISANSTTSTSANSTTSFSAQSSTSTSAKSTMSTSTKPTVRTSPKPTTSTSTKTTMATSAKSTASAITKTTTSTYKTTTDPPHPTTSLSQTTYSSFQSNGRVAFSASMEGNMFIPSRPATLKFGTVLTNMKHGYNPATGYFSAPVSGLYFIGGSITSPTRGWIKAEIVVQGQLVIIKLFAASANGQNQSSDFAIVSLHAGDVVWMRVIDFSNSVDMRHVRGTFSGYLIE